MKHLIFFTVISFALSDYLVFTSAKENALLYGRLLDRIPNNKENQEELELELTDITMVDNELNYPRNLAISFKNQKIYVCDVNYSSITTGYIYEYSYILSILIING